MKCLDCKYVRIVGSELHCVEPDTLKMIKKLDKTATFADVTNFEGGCEK